MAMTLGHWLVPSCGPDAAPTRALNERAREFAYASHASATRRAYRADFRDFERWCARASASSLPARPNKVALYLADIAGRLCARTAARRLGAIGLAHRVARYDDPSKDPVVRSVVAGIKRTFGAAQKRKDPVRLAHLQRMVSAISENTPKEIRDRALLLAGFAGALRRAELVNHDCADVTFDDKGEILKIRRSKTDQFADGAIVGIPWGQSLDTCPVSALKAWMRVLNCDHGLLFRSINRHGRMGNRLSGDSVARIVMKRAVAQGLTGKSFGAHSLRAGFVTEAAARGVPERDIMAQTRRRSPAVMRAYI